MTVRRKRVRPTKLPATSASDPEGPRLIPFQPEPASSLTGFGWVSLADTAMKVWDSAEKKDQQDNRKARKAAA